MMHPLASHPSCKGWNVRTIEITSDGFVPPLCQSCKTELEIHQPLEDVPGELLGTCSQCGRWNLIQISPDATEAILLDIPGLDQVRETLAKAWKDAGRKSPSDRRGSRHVKS